jgi:pyruvate/2-oxoacid:ferredoxin oxidoreductase beta subunit
MNFKEVSWESKVNKNGRDYKNEIIKLVQKSKSNGIKVLLKYEDVYKLINLFDHCGDGWAYDFGFGGLDHV